MPYTPLESFYEKEHRLMFEPKSPSGIFVVFSGNVEVNDFIEGKDDKFVTGDIYLIVGPWWKELRDVVPFVTVNGFRNNNADEDDAQGWSISNLTWDTIGGSEGPHLNEKRIRLIFQVQIKGENSDPMRFGYYVTASGRELGVGGLEG